jgi:transcriptional regulator with XRE-family HTH domain
MLAENLKNIRLERGLTQDEMAELLEYSYNGYAQVERGESIPKINKLKRISKILGIDLKELMASNEINTTVNITGNCHYGSVVLLTETQCAHELEKAQLLLNERNIEVEKLNLTLEEKNAEIERLRAENKSLKETENSLLKEVLKLIKTNSL